MHRFSFVFLGALALTACDFSKSSPDDDDDDIGGGGGWDSGSIGDGGSSDGGSSDGGSSDGGSSDGGSSDGGSGDGGSGDGGSGDGGSGDGGSGDGGSGDTGIFYSGYAGQATVTTGVGSTWSGFEDAYYIGLAGDLECIVRSDTTSLGARRDCAACDFAFDLAFTDSDFEANAGCAWLGVTDPSDYDTEYAYGYQSDYYISGYGYYETLNFYFSGYGWYPVALATFTGGTFTYDWPGRYYYYYYRD